MLKSIIYTNNLVYPFITVGKKVHLTIVILIAIGVIILLAIYACLFCLKTESFESGINFHIFINKKRTNYFFKIRKPYI